MRTLTPAQPTPAGSRELPLEHIFNVNHCVFSRWRIDHQPMTVIVFLQNNFRFDSFHVCHRIEFNKWGCVSSRPSARAARCQRRRGELNFRRGLSGNHTHGEDAIDDKTRQNLTATSLAAWHTLCAGKTMTASE